MAPISGNISGVLGDAHIVGNLNLTGNVYSEGLLTGIDTFRIQGNGFTWFFQNGGRADLHGKVKAAWGEWGTDATGWVAGDRLAVSPTKAGVFVPSELVWSNWSAARPVNSPDVTLVDGSVRKPEVVNLSQSIVLENLARGFHFHDSAGVQSLSDVKFLNCGTTGILGNYPIHFHQLYENSRGTLLERVVVEGGKNHAFVPHGSHGVTFKDCVAYNTTDDAWWWDPPLSNSIQTFDPNETNDALYDHCLALWVTGTAHRLTGYRLGRGVGNKCVNSVSVAVQGGNEGSGFHWPEVGVGNWLFEDCLAHNIKTFGLFTWQNSDLFHVIGRFDTYRNGRAGIEHGAYGNFYHYVDCTSTGSATALLAHAVSRKVDTLPDARLMFINMLTDGPLQVTKHNLSGVLPTIYRGCTFTGVIYNETNAGKSSYNVFEDCGLVPADFTFTIIQPGSTIDLLEGGVLQHRWASGVWS